MDKNTLYPLISIMVVLVVAAGVYIAADALGGTEPSHEEEEHEASGIEELFLGAVEQPLGHQHYTYRYEEEANSGYHANVKIVGAGDTSFVEKTDPVFTTRGYFEPNETILCYEFRGGEKCHVTNDSMFQRKAFSLEALVFEDYTTTARKRKLETLIRYGAIVFSEETGEKTVGGRECTEITYVLDYGKLTVEQLHEVGMTMDDPLLKMSSQYNYTMCINPETHELLEQRIDYLEFGIPVWASMEVTHQDWNNAEQFEIPTESTDEGTFGSFYNMMEAASKEYIICMEGTEPEACLLGVAIGYSIPTLCEETGEKRDVCLVNIGVGLEDTSYCNKVAPAIADLCHYEFAYHFENTTYCELIANESMKAECIEFITNMSAPECTKDGDCAVAGCSSQLCVPAEGAEDIVTTCEFLPEYECLSLTTCGCIEGTCQWRQTQDYSACLNNGNHDG